jgi:hypothetical protein
MCKTSLIDVRSDESDDDEADEEMEYYKEVVIHKVLTDLIKHHRQVVANWVAALRNHSSCRWNDFRQKRQKDVENIDDMLFVKKIRKENEKDREN